MTGAPTSPLSTQTDDGRIARENDERSARKEKSTRTKENTKKIPAARDKKSKHNALASAHSRGRRSKIPITKLRFLF